MAVCFVVEGEHYWDCSRGTMKPRRASELSLNDSLFLGRKKKDAFLDALLMLLLGHDAS